MSTDSLADRCRDSETEANEVQENKEHTLWNIQGSMGHVDSVEGLEFCNRKIRINKIKPTGCG